MKKFQSSACLILMFLLAGVTSFAQGNETGFLNNIFKAIQSRDSNEFQKYHMNSRDLQDVLTEFQRLEAEKRGKDDALPRSPDPTGYEKIVRSLVFSPLLKRIDSLTEKQTTLQFVEVQYQVVKSPYIVYPSLKGVIYFKGAGKDYQIPIDEAIYINGQWKIATLGTPGPVSAATVSHAGNAKVTAFGFINTVTITEVLIEEYVADEPTPPPHTPAKKKQKN